MGKDWVPSPSDGFLNWSQADKGLGSTQMCRVRIRKDFVSASRKSYCSEKTQVKWRRETVAKKKKNKKRRNKKGINFLKLTMEFRCTTVCVVGYISPAIRLTGRNATGIRSHIYCNSPSNSTLIQLAERLDRLVQGCEKITTIVVRSEN